MSTEMPFAVCDNCGRKPTLDELEAGDCPKCGDTLIAFTVDTALYVKELLCRLDALGKELAALIEDHERCMAGCNAEANARIEAERRLRTLQTALQRIVDGRFLGYAEAQVIARGALDCAEIGEPESTG